jgi:hypothetical protein
MWREILQSQCHARGLAAVSAQLGYSKATLSLVCSGKYGAETSNIEQVVLTHFGTLPCPFEARELTVQECGSWNQRDVPTSSSWGLQHWSACQTCPHNLAKENR